MRKTRLLSVENDSHLLDHYLEPKGFNGIEIGIHLRNLNEQIGMAIHSQFSVAPCQEKTFGCLKSRTTERTQQGKLANLDLELRSLILGPE